MHIEDELNIIFNAVDNATNDIVKPREASIEDEFSTKNKMTSSEAIAWYENELKNKSTKVQVVTNRRLLPGKIYIFKYNAETGENLSYWDRHPIALIFGLKDTTNGPVLLGINLSWYPLRARLFFLKTIRTLYKSKYDAEIKKAPNDAKNQGYVLLNLYKIKKLMDKVGFSFGMRIYKMENIQPTLTCIAYEEWKTVARMNTPPKYPQLVTEGYSLRRIYLNFIRYISYYNKNIGSMRDKLEENHRKGLFKLRK
jgi:hypothetical protein